MRSRKCKNCVVGCCQGAGEIEGDTGVKVEKRPVQRDPTVVYWGEQVLYSTV
jgi:hypothetical protein